MQKIENILEKFLVLSCAATSVIQECNSNEMTIEKQTEINPVLHDKQEVNLKSAPKHKSNNIKQKKLNKI